MIRLYRLIAISALLLMAVLISGCYTVIGHPSPVEEGIVEKETAEEQIYRYDESEYERPYPYYDSYYGLDSYYGFWYPGSYYYWDRPWRNYGYYSPRYYYDDHYYDYYAPEKRPETRRRGPSELRRTPRAEDRREIELERDEEEEQSERRVPERRRVEKRTQKSPEQRRDTTPEKRRSSRQKAEDEE